MHIGIGTCAFDHALPADQHNTPQKPDVHSALGIRTMGTELAMLLTAKALGLWRLLSLTMWDLHRLEIPRG
jgi:hypothetical protein